jgi:8-oxo-dGTP pyrophosphatase MutT (NUDIX family)
MAEKLFYIGVKGLIKNKQGKILLLKADTSSHRRDKTAYWDIPGGRIDEGESVLDALKREIKEETGINKLENHEFFTAVISNHQIPHGRQVIGLALMIYVVKVPAGSKVKLSEEHVAYEWVSRTEARQRLTHKYPKEFTDQL